MGRGKSTLPVVVLFIALLLPAVGTIGAATSTHTIIEQPKLGGVSSGPTASFSYSPDTPNPDDSISLDASGSTDNGTIVSYEWDTDGDGFYSDSQDATDGQTTTVSYQTGGTYTVRLRVTDDNENTDTVSKEIEVKNPAPNASFSSSPNTPHPDDSITLDASASYDGDGSIVSYEWDTDGDGFYSDSQDAADGETTTVSYDTGGTYTVRLRVTDNGDKTTTLTKQIEVDNPAPNASFDVSPSGVNPDETITLDASASSDSDGSIVSYEWDTDGDGFYSDSQDAADGETTTVSYETGGTYTVRLQVTDNGDKTTTLTKQIEVENPKPDPSFSYSPTTPNPDDTITLDASESSDSDGSITSYEWDSDGDGFYSDSQDAADGETSTVSYATAGTYTVRLRVQDNGDKTATTSKQIEVTNPTPNASFTYSPSTPSPDDTITLDASPSNDSDGSIISYEWDTDNDGFYSDSQDAADGKTSIISYGTAGTYTITLRVTDNGDKTATKTRTITVNNSVPSAAFSYSPNFPDPGETITLDAGNSSDPDGSITTYEWDTDDDGDYGDYDDVADGRVASTSFDTSGSHTVGLKVTDNGGLTWTTSQTIEVDEGPTASFETNPSEVLVGQPVELKANDSSDDGEISEYQWTLPGNTTREGEVISYRPSAAGTYQLNLTVTDDVGQQANTSTTVTVFERPAVDIAWTPAKPADEASVNFTASTNSSLKSYSWDFDGDDTWEASGSETSHRFPDGGTQTVRLRVTTTDDLQTIYQENMTVREVRPNASISRNVSVIQAGAGVAFSAQSADNVTEYAWDFNGDGTADKTGTNVTYTFSTAGRQNVSLTVTDEYGDTGTVAKRLQVKPAPSFTLAASAGDTTTTTSGEAKVVFNISNPRPDSTMQARLDFDLPANVSVDRIKGATMTNGTRTSAITLAGGESKELVMRFKSNDSGQHTVTGRATYSYENGSTEHRQALGTIAVVNSSSASAQSGTQEPSSSNFLVPVAGLLIIGLVVIGGVGILGTGVWFITRGGDSATEPHPQETDERSTDTAEEDPDTPPTTVPAATRESLITATESLEQAGDLLANDELIGAETALQKARQQLYDVDTSISDVEPTLSELQTTHNERYSTLDARRRDRYIPEQVPDAPAVSVDYTTGIDEERIGVGGNADVVKIMVAGATGEVPVAIKKPRVAGTLHKDSVERLIGEAKKWTEVADHAHIVDVIDFGSEPLPWIAMEYMDGGHLGERAGEMTLSQAVWTAQAVTNGVKHAHRHGIAHLDLKPENILFRTVDDAWDVPKVSDWGLSKHLLRHSNSIEGMTPTYAAPEQFNDDYGATDEITDVYQLGAVFYEVFTGRPPFEGEHTQVMRAVLDEEPAPPSEVADVPAGLDDVLLTALAKNKDDRYEDIVYFRDAFDEVLNRWWD